MLWGRLCFYPLCVINPPCVTGSGSCSNRLRGISVKYIIITYTHVAHHTTPHHCVFGIHTHSLYTTPLLDERAHTDTHTRDLCTILLCVYDFTYAYSYSASVHCVCDGRRV